MLNSQTQDHLHTRVDYANDAEQSSTTRQFAKEYAALDEIVGYCQSKRRALIQSPEKRRTPTTCHHIGIFRLRRMIGAMPNRKSDLTRLKEFARREINGIDRCEGHVVPTLDDLVAHCEAKQSQLR